MAEFRGRLEHLKEISSSRWKDVKRKPFIYAGSFAFYSTATVLAGKAVFRYLSGNADTVPSDLAYAAVFSAIGLMINATAWLDD
ncbi:MAG: hypothetical protein HYW26_00665 [Candidatus Aenigmarchaeota archaeon]|nr:hypothetical protein [Candidatus Aenigmarchaeota archaeon]